jgi:LuxR family maltose regulon positive regulatory protein
MLAAEQQYADLAKKLEQIQVQRLTKEEQDEVGSLFSALPQDILDASPELTYSMILLGIQRGNIGAAQKGYASLVGMRDRLKENAPGRKLLENRVFCAALDMPLETNTNLLLNLAVLASEAADAKFPLAKLSVTGKLPSVLRGAKDLSSLAKHYRAVVSIVRPLLGAFLEDNGTGVCETAIAEVLYERNDLNEASLQAAAAMNAENPEVAFAALSLMARISVVDTSATPPAEILSHIGGILEKKQAYWLLPNYHALCARFDILRGDTEKVRAWLDSCGFSDLDGFTLRDSYGLLTKAKAYIALGEYRNAATLLEGLTLAMQKEQRVLDTIECLANGAIVCELMGNGDRATAKLEQALLLAQDYGYVRVFADLGKQLFHLLARYVKEGQPDAKINEKYIKRITESASIFSTLCPALYETKTAVEEAGEADELTQSEVHVLQLLDAGKPNKAIAADLHVQPSTVNFHLRNIFEKLGVSNRTEAVKRAREKGLLA